jgi:hypothetical protein
MIPIHIVTKTTSATAQHPLFKPSHRAIACQPRRHRGRRSGDAARARPF